MIIKIKGIKASGSGLGSLIKYVATDKGAIKDYREQGVFQNLLQTDFDSIQNEFEQNYSQFAERKNARSNTAVHVILSLSPIDREHATLELMDELSQVVISKAYPNAIVFGTHHLSQQHWHSHLIVSANDFGEQKSTNLTKTQLREVHSHVLEHIQNHHKELSIGFEMDDWGHKLGLSNGEYHREKRGKTLAKDTLKLEVQNLFRGSSNLKDFYYRLEQSGYKTYTHKDEIKGIYWDDNGTDKKMRFSRLGISNDLQQQLTEQEQRLQELEQLRTDMDSKTLEHDMERTT